MAVQIQLRRGTSADWSSVNPVIAQGEFVIELDTGRFKIGNGLARWNELPYAGLVGQGNDPNNWDNNTKLGIYEVTRGDWSGTVGTPTDAISIGLLVVFVSGSNVVQRYQPSNETSTNTEYIRTKMATGPWSAWAQSADGGTLDGGTF